jgi:hypothetical protein
MGSLLKGAGFETWLAPRLHDPRRDGGENAVSALSQPRAAVHGKNLRVEKVHQQQLQADRTEGGKFQHFLQHGFSFRPLRLKRVAQGLLVALDQCPQPHHLRLCELDFDCTIPALFQLPVNFRLVHDGV